MALQVKSSKTWDPEIIKFIDKNGSVNLVAYRKFKALNARDHNDNKMKSPVGKSHGRK